MRNCLMCFCCLILIIIVSVIPGNIGRSVATEDDDGNLADNNYPDFDLEKLFRPAQKRDCVRRGGSCTTNPGGCCREDSCKCNVWGANCRCYSQALYQKWI
ncbi:unnamed protein product [Bemisia tabaci]|uniref:Uncharacterized protein n=1 Tax=Bemisia tabaci TaxID=7038 RepID=A0A9P0F6Z7_BEMTA|nr:PREDICTED: U8-agatoxin-Ao1a-like [Bemisia tabaci]CAH0392346.1 unnamed protein product [Bemisia tabaci]